MAIVLAVIVEELGIPLPIPTDFLIVVAGAGSGGVTPRLGLYLLVLALASGIGATGLYAIVRRGGRPLVDRFGPYVRLGPAQISRAENLLARGGWGAIALGRARGTIDETKERELVDALIEELPLQIVDARL